MNGLTMGCLSLGRGPDGSKEVSEKLGVSASESHRVVSLGFGSNDAKEVSEMMGLARAMSVASVNLDNMWGSFLRFILHG